MSVLSDYLSINQSTYLIFIWKYYITEKLQSIEKVI